MKKKILFKQRLLNDFFFPQTIQKIKETKDSKFLFATGLYPPQLKCFNLEKLSVKFKRNLDSEIIDFQILTPNWEKLVLLRQDRYLEFHSKSGCHYQLRLNKKGTDLVFDSYANILYIPSNSNEIFRIDLMEGKFLSSIKTNPEISFHCSGISPVSNLIGTGTSTGLSQFWDPRSLKKPIGILKTFMTLKHTINPVSSIRFNNNYSHFCYTGQSQGETVIFDLRSFGPILVKKNKRKESIKTIRTNFNGNLILSSNNETINLWNEKNGKTWKTIEIQSKINHVCRIKNSGFFLIATDGPFPETKFLENLGGSPFWIPKQFFVPRIQKKILDQKKPFL
mmetsp:Transcript_35438/g.70917  ORF Transcript_35438/g.70917 Transcript_35438/m.70917 type:complete len:337 (-) Transcript_35438:762-1772(-)